MHTTIKWLREALATKDLVAGMTHYCVRDGEIRATDGRITAGHPWQWEGEFLVPGMEFEKVLARMPETPKLKLKDNVLELRAKRFSGTINTLPLAEWDYPDVEDSRWQALPEDLLLALRALRPFISDNATQAWAMTVALDNGWAYATNNVSVAGMPFMKKSKSKALLPSWAVDFVLTRENGLTAWAWTDHYVAFRWESGAWMRSQLVVGEFPASAAELVRAAHKESPTQEITQDFRAAFMEVLGVAEDTIAIHKDKITGGFGKAVLSATAHCEVPEGCEASLWGAKLLEPIIRSATHWSPSVWPKPAPFKGDHIAGYIVGRRA